MIRMEKFMEKVMPFASAVAGQRHLLAMRDAMIRIIPFTLACSFFTLIFRFPWNPYQDFMTMLLGEDWGYWVCEVMVPAIIGMIALLGAASTAVSLSKSYGHDGIEPGILALVAYVILIWPENQSQISFFFAGKGLWLAMLVGLATAELQQHLGYLQNRTAGTKIPQAFVRSICPMLRVVFIVSVFIGLKFLLHHIFDGRFQEIWMNGIQRLLFSSGTSLPGTLLAQVINSIFWGMGLHGAQLVNGVMLPVWMTQSLENFEIFLAGGTIFPHIVTKQFIELFIWTGGSAGSLSMVVWIKFFAKSGHVQQIGRRALLPAIFNIDEPVVFGLPVVFNPILIFPFILAPAVTTVFSYITMAQGIFPKLCGIDLPWSTPVFISGFLATNGDFGGVLLQLCNLVISFFIYAPFIFMYDRQMMKRDGENKE